jgi:hypothetical protein
MKRMEFSVRRNPCLIKVQSNHLMVKLNPRLGLALIWRMFFQIRWNPRKSVASLSHFSASGDFVTGGLGRVPVALVIVTSSKSSEGTI